jgi:ribonuclease III
LQLPHQFRDPILAKLALTHRSMGRPNNERLEFLGDALLGAVVAELLYEAHPSASEGELSRLRAQLVSGPALASLARELALGESLQLGPGELKSGGFRRDSILADAFEALIAAIYLDAGFARCREVLRGLFARRVAELRKSSKDAKTRLQEWLQGKGLQLPHYELVASYGEDHAKTFVVACMVEQPQLIRAEADGHSRRVAEQNAAENVLHRLWDKEHHD